MVAHVADVILQPLFMFNSFSLHVQIGCIYDIIFYLLPVCLCTHSLFCMLLKIWCILKNWDWFAYLIQTCFYVKQWYM